MTIEEGEHSPPRVLARFGVLLVAAVEERVRRAGVYVNLVVESRLGQAGVEQLDLLDRDGLVGAAEQAEQRHPDLSGAVEGSRRAGARSAEDSVEPDHRGKLRGVGAGLE